MWWMYVLWGLVVATTLLDYRRIPLHIQALREGWKGIAFLPVALAILFSLLALSLVLANAVPVLEWGWLGTNIAAAPLVDVIDASGETGITGIAVIEVILFALTIAFLCLISNYYEEEMFRSTYKLVAIWALLHLIMGIPLYMVIPIFGLGLLYKYVHNKYSFQRAFALHFSTNVSIIIIALLAFVWGI